MQQGSEGANLHSPIFQTKKNIRESDLMSKPTARKPNIQPTAAPVSGKKPPQSRCALSRWSKTRKSRNGWSCSPMINVKILTFFFAACLFLTSCAYHDSRETLSKQMFEHKSRTLAAWSGWQKKDIREKIVPAPDILLDYLHIDNKISSYDKVTQPATQWQSFADEVFQAIDEFPPEVKRHLNEHVIGIFLVSDLGSSAFTDIIRDSTPPLGFIVLDSQSLNRKANEWASWKENTPFSPYSKMETRVIIESKVGDTRKNAISYIILHELGHLVGVTKEVHANWWDKGNHNDYPFASISWTRRNDSLASKWDDTFQNRSRVRFYANEKSQLAGDERTSIYANLEKTDFVSLYAATGSYDDFAETYAMYAHVVLQKRPWELEVLREGKPIFRMTEPILQARSKYKRAFLAKLFETKSQAEVTLTH